MSDVELTALIVIALALAGLYLLFGASRRSALDVYQDIAIDVEGMGRGSREELTRRDRMTFSDPLGKAGLLSAEERREFKARGRLYPVVGGLAGVGVKVLLFPGSSTMIAIAGVVGAALGVIAGERRIRNLTLCYNRTLEFHLPIVMERLVMAVQSGLDILAALRAIIELDSESATTRRNGPDPVTRLLGVVHRLTEEGLVFEQALREVASWVDCSAIRHSFIHLAVAHQEGGELVMPLKELSDSTQLYYQETVDEQIAKLPVKATMPLLCTFSGLILCFVTSPLIQLMHLAGGTIKNLQ